MDIMQAIIAMLRGKPGAEGVQADQDPQAMASGVQAASNPAYAAYVREAKSMGETPISAEEYAKQGSR